MARKVIPFTSPPCPLHPNCRCIKLPVTKSYRELGLDINDIEEVARPYTIRENKVIGMGGRLILDGGRMKGTYADFYYSRGPIFQKNLLGPTRQRLIDSDFIDFKDLVDSQTGRLFTIAELEESLGMAFLKWNELDPKQKNIIASLKLHHLKKGKIPKEGSKTLNVWNELDADQQDMLIIKWQDAGIDIHPDLPIKSKLKQTKVVKDKIEIPKATKANTLDEFSDYQDALEDVGVGQISITAKGAKETSLEHFQDSIMAIENVLLDVYEDLPKVQELVTSKKSFTIEFGGKKMKSPTSKKSVNGYYFMDMEGKGHITLRKFSDVTDDLVIYNSYSVSGNKLMGTFKHEFSHHLFELLDEDVKKDFYNLYKTKGPEFFKKNISTYAATNTKEAFAECSALYLHKGYDGLSIKLPKEVESFFQKAYGKKPKMVADIPKVIPKSPVKEVLDEGLYFSELDKKQKGSIASLKTHFLKKGKIPNENSKPMQTWKLLKASEQQKIMDDFVTKGGEIHPDLPMKKVIKEVDVPEKKLDNKALKWFNDDLENPDGHTKFTSEFIIPEGSKFKPIKKLEDLEIQTKPLKLPSMKKVAGKHDAAGVIMVDEAGEKVWIYEPKNHFGGYKHTFPKGTIEGGLGAQETAIKEAWEETGLQAKIIGYLGDYEKSTSINRYYIGKVTGGSPTSYGWETQSVKYIPTKNLKKFLNVDIDKKIADDLIEMLDDAKLFKTPDDSLEKALDKVQEISKKVETVAKKEYDDIIKQARMNKSQIEDALEDLDLTGNYTGIVPKAKEALLDKKIDVVHYEINSLGQQALDVLVSDPGFDTLPFEAKMKKIGEIGKQYKLTPKKKIVFAIDENFELTDDFVGALSSKEADELIVQLTDKVMEGVPIHPDLQYAMEMLIDKDSFLDMSGKTQLKEMISIIKKTKDDFDPLKILMGGVDKDLPPVGEAIDDAGVLFADLDKKQKGAIASLKTHFLKKGKIPKENSKPMQTWMSLKASEQENILAKFVEKGGVVPKELPVKEGVGNMFGKVTDIKPATEIKKVLNIEDYVKYEGQKGSNVGGYYHAKTNPADRWYMKFPDNEEIAKNEILAGKLYEKAGVDVPTLKLVERDGKMGVASRVIDGVKRDVDLLTSGNVTGIHDNFVVDAWLSNWDVVGLANDNLLVKDGIKAIRIDAGGCLRYRAQGGLKGSAFGRKVTEIESLLNPSMSRQSARVFKGITQEQLEAGARKVLGIDDSTIAQLVREYGPSSKAERDELIKILIARKRDIRKKFPKAMKKTKLPEADFEKITPVEVQTIKESRINGYVIKTDKDDIEDQSVLYWTQKSKEGKNQILATFKVRGKAANKLNKLAKEAEDFSADNFSTADIYNEIKIAMRGVAMQSRTNAPLRAKDIRRAVSARKVYNESIETMKKMVANGEILQSDLDSVKKYYAVHIRRIDAVVDSGVGSSFKLPNDVSGYPDLPGAHDLIKIKKVKKKKVVEFSFQKRSGRFEEKKIVNGHAVETGEFISLDYSDSFEHYMEVEVDGVRIRYWPNTKDISLAHRGKVEIMTYGKSVDDISGITEMMEKLGVNAKKATLMDQEELYLRQIFYARGNSDEFDEVMNGVKNIIGQEEKIKYMRSELNRRAGFDVTDSPDYNPEGVYQAFGQGRKNTYRPDLDPLQWKTFQEEYKIHHSNTNSSISDTVENILKGGGQFAPTTDKLRRGFRWGGMSPTADMKSGGASYFFTRIVKTKTAAKRHGFVWKSKLLARNDAISYGGDNYGRVSSNFVLPNRAGSIKGWKSHAGSGSNETIFKNSLSIFDDLEAINVETAGERDEIIQLFKNHLRSDKFPDGRKITEVVKKVG
jgi:ADP-ribose pyrophosphatase YjhB (NUDIX family)